MATILEVKGSVQSNSLEFVDPFLFFVRGLFMSLASFPSATHLFNLFNTHSYRTYALLCMCVCAYVPVCVVVCVCVHAESLPMFVCVDACQV